MSIKAKWMTHSSDCALHNEPATPNGECDCGVKFAEREAVTRVNEMACGSLSPDMYEKWQDVMVKISDKRSLA